MERHEFLPDEVTGGRCARAWSSPGLICNGRPEDPDHQLDDGKIFSAALNGSPQPVEEVRCNLCGSQFPADQRHNCGSMRMKSCAICWSVIMSEDWDRHVAWHEELQEVKSDLLATEKGMERNGDRAVRQSRRAVKAEVRVKALEDRLEEDISRVIGYIVALDKAWNERDEARARIDLLNSLGSGD